MKTSHPKTFFLLIVLALLLAACGKTTAPESTSPEVSAIPELTATPVPPTSTPSPEEILAEGWQAFEDGDLETARQIG